MRALVLLSLLSLAACEQGMWTVPTTAQAPSGITAYSNGLNSTTGGGERPFSARGSQATYGLGVQR